MALADRVARRFMARGAPQGLEFFEDEEATALSAITDLNNYEKILLKARDILRPVAECLRSKALGKIYVDLTEAIGRIPVLRRDVEGIIADLEQVDHALLLEARRHADIARGKPDDYEIDPKDIRLPVAVIKALQSRIKRYHATVEKTFDNLSFSVDEIGTAGSMDLKAYERLIEKLPGWEELNIVDIDIDGLDDAVAARAIDEI